MENLTSFFSPSDLDIYKLCSEKNYPQIKKLIETGAIKEIGNVLAYNVIYRACCDKQLGIVKTLLNYFPMLNFDLLNSVHIDSPLFIKVVTLGDLQLVDLLLCHGLSCTPKKNILSPLHIAARERKKEIAELLLSYGADANFLDDKGDTPINYAISSNSDLELFLIIYPLYFQAVHDKTNQNIKTLRFAMEFGFYGMVKLLIRKGVLPDSEVLTVAKNNYLKIKSCDNAEEKKPYQLIGQIFIKYLRLFGAVGSPTNRPISKSGIMKIYNGRIPFDILKQIAVYACQ